MANVPGFGNSVDNSETESRGVSTKHKFTDRYSEKNKQGVPLVPSHRWFSLDISEVYSSLYLFPQNYEFYKDDVIHLWDPYILNPLSSSSSARGKARFKELERLGLIQMVCKDDDDSTGRPRYKLSNSGLHLLETDRISFSSEYIRIKSGQPFFANHARHVSVQGCIDSVTLTNLYKAKSLRTLLLFPEQGAEVNSIPHELFLRLQLISVLDLSHTNISELPSSIGTLKDLLYLNLSWTPVTALPNSLSNLCKLKFLKLRGCLKLTSLPKGMRKLRRLTCLDIDVVSASFSMPPGLGNLRFLETLPAFIVYRERGCQISELKNLAILRGTLCILKLENVLSSEEAKEAALDQKQYLKKLELHWTETQDGFDVLENLRPYQALKELQIVGYGGHQFPSWVGGTIFYRLKSITIHGCTNCQLLPQLGKLPRLKFLFISDVDSVVIIDHQFCARNGVEDGAFPKLESFTLSGASNLEKWNGVEDGDFPCLEKLNISDCSKLTTLPYFSSLKSLQQLEISHCPILESFLDEELPVSLHSLVIIYCPLLKKQYYEDEAQNGRGITNIADVWIDYQRISKAQRDALPPQ